MRLLAAGCFAAALLLIRPPGRWLVATRFGLPSGLPVMLTALRRLVLSTVLLAGAVTVLWLGGTLSRLIAGMTGVGVGVVLLRLRLRSRAAAVRKRRATRNAELIDAFAAELGAGVLPAHALVHLAEDTPELAATAAAARLGGDVPHALRLAAELPGAEVLGELASAWEVSERSGAPMATVLDRLAERMRDDRELRREIDAGLGPARSTARIMAVLPLFGLGMGAGAGADPVHILLGTLPGAVCLAAGAGLACVGVLWVERIAVRVERLG